MNFQEIVRTLKKISEKWREDILHGYGSVEDCCEELNLIVEKMEKNYNYDKKA